MHKITAQLKILFFSAAFLLPAISALASLQTPTLPDLQELQEECFADPAHIPDNCPDQLTWQQLEAENAVLAVLMIPDNPFEALWGRDHWCRSGKRSSIRLSAFG